MVFQFINSSELNEYYKIRASLPDAKKQRARPIASNPQLENIDDPVKQVKYLLTNSDDVPQALSAKSVKFFVDGLHCFACVWILEKLPMLSEEVVAVRVNYFEKSLVLSVPNNSKFSEGVGLIQNLGYSLHPVSSNSDLEKLKSANQKKLLYRVGVAGVATGNIMLCAVAVYAGAEDSWKILLDYVSGMFFLPILFYSAIPILKNAFFSIKNKQYSLDIAAAFSIILGSSLSFFNLFHQTGDIYFDSIATFVFLLMSAKYILLRSNNIAAHLDTLDFQITPNYCFKIDSNTSKREKVDVVEIQEGDLIALQAGEVAPIDGAVWQGESYFDNSAITGESHPVKIKKGARVSAGSRNIDSEVLIKSTSTHNSSSLSLMMDHISKGWRGKGKILNLTEKISFILFSCVIISSLATVIIVSSQGLYSEALHRLLAILVIACPCALGIGAPLALGYSLKTLVQNGIIVKDSDVLDSASKITKVFFDKTGTLTQGSLDLIDWAGERNDELENIVFNIEKYSLHPIAQSLSQHLGARRTIPSLDLINYKEDKGRGVFAEINGSIWSLEKFNGDKPKHPHASACSLNLNGTSKAVLYFRDDLKLNSVSCIRELKSEGIQTGILSGDRKGVVDYWADRLNIPSSNVFADLSPSQKSEIIDASSNVAMVGDGINDAMALTKSDVGIAVKGSLGASLKSSGVILLDHDVRKIGYFIQFSKNVMKLIRKNIYFSMSYNLIGISLASMGYINPLAAAILMPISSLWIIFNVTWFFNREDKERITWESAQEIAI